MNQHRRGDPRNVDAPASVAQSAHDLPWLHWQMEEERWRTRTLLALVIPSSALFFLLDLRFEGAQLWLNLALRATFMSFLIAALVELTRAKHPRRVLRMLSA